MRMVVLRSVSFVLTPPAISIPVSKEVTSKNSRSCTCKDASPERMTTKMNSASHSRSRGAEWRSSGSSRFSEKRNWLPHQSQRRRHWKEPACCSGAAGKDRKDQQFDMTLESMHVPRTNPPAKPRQAGARGTAEGAIQMSLHMEHLAALR